MKNRHNRLKNMEKNRIQPIIRIVAFVAIFCGFATTISAQIIGSRNNSESSPKKVEPAQLSGGDFVGDVNLLNGSYNGSIPLGAVNTPGGIGYTLSLQYSSDFTIGNTKPMCSGIPYGEGWDLNLPSISVESDVFHNFMMYLECDENVGGVNQNKLHFGENGASAANEGDLYWFSPMINIPGVVSGRAIFKYVDVSDANAVVFAMNKFEEAVEIRFYGDAWRIILADGSQYVFDAHISNYRAPSNKRVLYYDQDLLNNENNLAQDVNQAGNYLSPSIKENVRNAVEPKETYSVWYCSNISNRNIPLQGVNFVYKGFGKFNYFEEFQQEGYSYVSKDILSSSSFPYSPDFSAYTELLLVGLTSYVAESPVDLLELEYKVLDAAINASSANGSGLINLATGDNLPKGVYDEMYSFETIKLATPSSGFSNWKKYQHCKKTSFLQNISPYNPYININDNTYNRFSATGGTYGIAFDHSFLESERVSSNSIYPGDIYQIKTKIHRTTGSLIEGNGTLDIALVTGKCGYSATQNGQEFTNLDLDASTNKYAAANYEATRGVTIFSTFNSALKWQMGYNKNELSTSNFFTMPNIPSDYGGFNIQVGPGNSDLDYAIEPTVNSDNAMVSGTVQDDPETRYIKGQFAYPFNSNGREIKSAGDVGGNFGIGFPWGMMTPIYNKIALNSGLLNGSAADPKELYKLWWFNNSNPNPLFDNIPTKFGENTFLNEVQLIHYSKNPYMLQAVRLYHFNGESIDGSLIGKKLVAQKRLEYEVVTERVIENYEYETGNTLQTSTKNRLIILLKKVTDVPLNSTDIFASDYGVVAGTTISTSLTYTAFYEELAVSNVAYDQTRPFKGHQQYLLTQFIDNLGGITQITYNDATDHLLTPIWNRYEHPVHCNAVQPDFPYGQDRVYTVHPTVKFLEKNDENENLTGGSAYLTAHPDIVKKWEYVYDVNHIIVSRKEYLTSSGTSTGFYNFRRNNSVQNDFTGYRKVTVINPKLESGEQNRTEYEYYGNILGETPTIDGYLLTGKMKSQKTFSSSNVLHDEKLINYAYTLAYKNGYDRPNFMRDHMQTSDGAQLGKEYEYKDIYKNEILTIQDPLNPTQLITGPAAYSYVAPPYMNGNFGWGEKPKMLEFYFYNELRGIAENPEYLFYSYFIKKTDETNKVYENSLSKSGIVRPTLPFVGKPVVKDPFGSGHTNPIAANTIKDNEVKTLIANNPTAAASRLTKMSPQPDNVLLYFLSFSSITASDKHDVLIRQGGISNAVWAEVVNHLDDYTSDQIKHLINVQPYISDAIQQQVIHTATSQTDKKSYEAFFLKNGMISDEVKIELTKSSNTVPAGSFEAILSQQENMTNDVLKSIVASTKLNDQNMVSILGKSAITDDLFLKIVKDERFTERSLPDLFVQTVSYPSDKVLLEVLNKGSLLSDVAYQQIFEAAPRELGAAVNEKIDQLFSCELQLLLKPSLGSNPLAKFCSNPVLEGRKCIESKTSFEYYEADYTGKAIGRAYNVLMNVPEGERTLTTGYIENRPWNYPYLVTVNSLQLKHEPSWQVFSVKTTSPHLPGAYNQEEYFYLFDLQNRYDRYWFNYDYTTNNFEAEYFTVPMGVTEWSDILVHNNLFPDEYRAENGSAPSLPPMDGMMKSRSSNLRTHAFQKTTFSKNQTDVNPVSSSEYYFYDARWKLDDYSSLVTETFAGPPCPEPDPCSGSFTNCTDCYTAKFISWEYLISQLPQGYCIWTTNSMENGQNYWFCPSSADVHQYDETAELVYCFGFDVDPNGEAGMVPDPESYKTFHNLPKSRFLKFEDLPSLQLRNVTFQVDEIIVSDPADPFIQQRMTTSSSYVAEFKIGGSGSFDDQNFRNPYQMVYPYKTLTPRTVLKRNRYFQPALEENQVGLQTRYFYDEADNIWHVNTNCLSGLGNYQSTTNTNIGLPIKITIGEGRADALTTLYEYTEIGLVKKTTDPSGKTMEYTFDDLNRLLTATENSTRLLNEYSYRAWNHNNAVSFAGRTSQNYVQTISYNSATFGDYQTQKAFLDPLGRTQSAIIAYTDGAGNNVQIHSASTAYDNWSRVMKTYKNYVVLNNQINSSDNFSSSFMENQYENNPKGRPVKAANYGVAIATNQTVKMEYHIVNNVYASCELGLSKSELEMIMATGNTSNFQFWRSRSVDQNGALDQRGHEIIEYKNAFGQLVATLQYNDGGEKVVTLFGYDSYGNQTKVINPKKQVTRYVYNMLGQLVKETSVDAGTKRYMYNKQGLVAVTQDEVGRINKAIDYNPRPYYRSFKYDIYGRLLKTGRTDVVTPYPYSAVYDALYYETKTEAIGLNANNEPIELSDGSTHFYFNYQFSSASTQDWLCSYQIGISVYDNNASETFNITTQSGFDNAFVIAMAEKEFAYGLETSVNSIGKLVRSYSYNNEGVKVQRTDLTYDAQDRIASQVTQFNKNQLDENAMVNNIVSKIYYPNYNYKGDLLEEKVDVNGDNITDVYFFNEYDKLNRLSSVKVALGEVTSAADATLLVSYTYDDATGKMTSKKHFVDASNPSAALLNYLVTTIRYNYDDRERLTNIKATSVQQNLMDYGLYYDYQSPAVGSSFADFNQNFNGNINGTSMRYDFTGDAILNPLMQLEDFENEMVYGYKYDKLNRLTSADATIADFIETSDPLTYNIGDESYTYDKIGNIKDLKRTLKNNDLTVGALLTKIEHFGYQYASGNNRLQQVNGLEGTTSRHYSYDANGNLLTDDYKKITSSEYGRASYAYHLTKLEDNGNIENISYIYDVNDARIYKKSVASTGTNEEYYLQDAMGRSLAILDMQATEWSYYLFGAEREAHIQPAVAQKPGSNAVNTDYKVQLGSAVVSFYLYDHLGNTRVTYTPNNLYTLPDHVTIIVQSTINNVVDYFPYGKIVREYKNNSIEEKYLTTQHERDAETGLDYRGARFYDCDVARFLSVDPWATKYPSWSTYCYVKGNPIGFVDPGGDTVARFTWDGKYIGWIDDGQEYWIGRRENAIANKDENGKIVSYSHEKFEFADPVHDPQLLKDGIVTHLVFVYETNIKQMLKNAEVFDPSHQGPIDGYYFLDKEGQGGGKLDFSLTQIPSFKWNYNQKVSIDYSAVNNRTDAFFYVKSQKTAYNHFNFGNFMFGASGEAVGYSLSVLLIGAHKNSIQNSKKNGYKSQIDSFDDQMSIARGYQFALEHNYEDISITPNSP